METVFADSGYAGDQMAQATAIAFLYVASVMLLIRRPAGAP